jgi:hypothetical protein
LTLTIILNLMRHSAVLQHPSEDLSAQSQALSDEARVLARIHGLDCDKEVLVADDESEQADRQHNDH